MIFLFASIKPAAAWMWHHSSTRVSLSDRNNLVVQHMSALEVENYDVFLSHAHVDAEAVEKIGQVLLNLGITVWLDKWVLVPGDLWQQEMARGLDHASTCAVCIGQTTPKGWFQQEIQRALNRQAKEKTFRVIPVILPEGDTGIVDDFLELRTWIEFKNGHDDSAAVHLLTCGIRGIPPGASISHHTEGPDEVKRIREKLIRLRTLRNEKLIDEVIAQEAQRRLVNQILGL